MEASLVDSSDVRLILHFCDTQNPFTPLTSGGFILGVGVALQLFGQRG